MQHDPVLAAATIRRPHTKVALLFRVYGGLHYLRGNPKPYFSLTYWEHRKGFPYQCQSGGAGHDEILARFPQFADLAALHLSDIDGVPSHAEANGWYKLAGALGGMREQYHCGNSQYHFPVEPPADKPWANTEYRLPTKDECLQMFADHIRVPLEEARTIAEQVAAGPKDNLTSVRAAEARERWKAIVPTMLSRWKQEAEACIAKHKLVVYGDDWQG